MANAVQHERRPRHLLQVWLRAVAEVEFSEGFCTFSWHATSDDLDLSF